MKTSIFAVAIVALIVFTTTAAVSASFWHTKVLQQQPKTEEEGIPATFHQCEHDKIKHRQKTQTIKVDYEFHSNERFISNKKADDKKSVHQMRQAEALAVNPAGTLGNMRFQSFFDSATCPGADCGRCDTESQTVQTFEGGTVSCAKDDVLDSAKRDYVTNKLMPKAMQILSSLLRINPVVGNLNPGSGYCGSPGTPIPAAHTASGVANADFIIYVTAAPKADPNSQTVAWALKCAQDASNRPTVAHVNFIPRRLTNAAALDAIKMESDTMTAVHEICHALGFASPFFGGNGYVDLSRTPQAGGTMTVGASAPLNKARTYINSPRVVNEVRSYFGCATAVGAEIEDQGGAGTSGSHFEKRIYQQHIMSGISTTVATYPSKLLLAFFEDTGHYLPNYTAIDQFHNGHITFGRGKGCAFLDERCDSATNKASGEWCFSLDSTQKLCSFDGLAKGYCGATSSLSGVPVNMQYFGDASSGSSIQLDDFCPSPAYYSNQRCVDLSTTPVAGGGEFYGGNSRCFQSNLKGTISALGTGTAGSDGSAATSTRCFQAYCHADGSMSVVVDLRLYPCPTAGGKATLAGLKGYNGEIICPPAVNYCPQNWTSADGGLPHMVPSPEETSTIYAPSYGKPVPGACKAREPCAVSKLGLMPACRRFAFEVGRCFGTDCDAHMQNWLKTVGGLGSNCSSGRGAFDKYCQEDTAGSGAVCNLASAGAMLSWIAAVVLAVMLLVL